MRKQIGLILTLLYLTGMTNARAQDVSEANLKRDVTHLATAWPNRHTLGPNLGNAADWIANRLRSLGYKDVKLFEYTRDGHTLQNVVCIKPGKTKQTIVVGAHYDSRAQNLDDPNTPAPGANDNGTGVAALLEAARLLKNVKLNQTVQFVFFSGEEQDLWGSEAYTRALKASKTPVTFMFNLDEIGFPPPDRAVFVDEDRGNVVKSNDAESRRLVARARAVAVRLHILTRVDPAYASDYMPFEALGYPIVGLYEAGKNYPAYHRFDDTPEKVDFAYVRDMTRLTVAFLLSEAR